MVPPGRRPRRRAGWRRNSARRCRWRSRRAPRERRARGPVAGPGRYSRAVDALLGILEFIVEEYLHRVGRGGDVFGGGELPRAGRTLEHVVRSLFLGRRLADADL